MNAGGTALQSNLWVKPFDEISQVQVLGSFLAWRLAHIVVVGLHKNALSSIHAIKSGIRIHHNGRQATADLHAAERGPAALMSCSIANGGGHGQLCNAGQQ